MATIAFDSSSGGQTGGATTLTYSHTCSGSNRILFVGVNCGSEAVSGITYNGVAMTFVGTSNFAPLYKLFNPATGANNVVVSFGGTTTASSVSASYTGAKQSSNPESSTNSSAGSSPNPYTQAITTTTDLSWAVIMTTVTKNSAVTAGTATTLRVNNTYVAGSLTCAILDSNGVVSPAGSRTLEINQGTGGYNATIFSLVRLAETFSSTTSETVSLTETVKSGVGIPTIKETVSLTETYDTQSTLTHWDNESKPDTDWINETK